METQWTKQCRSRLAGSWKSQLIWIYTVYKKDISKFISPILKKGDNSIPPITGLYLWHQYAGRYLKTLCTATWSNILMFICLVMHSMASGNVVLVNRSWSWLYKTMWRDSMMGSRSTLCCLISVRHLIKSRTNQTAGEARPLWGERPSKQVDCQLSGGQATWGRPRTRPNRHHTRNCPRTSALSGVQCIDMELYCW